ncbi:MAG: hypothetical protein NTW95_05850 [Candidatus Aminicenantes bacterium]|nr:hypothetical protein [Candidatus Aminicenantes bacterium]
MSFGTHFFQDLVESSIRYLPLYPDDEGVMFNEKFLLSATNYLPDMLPEFAGLADTIRVIDVPKAAAGKILRVLMNADQNEAIGFLSTPASGGEPVKERREHSESVMFVAEIEQDVESMTVRLNGRGFIEVVPA